MNKEDLIKRTKIFAHNCIKVAVDLPRTKLGYHIEGQLIRCSTSVAANYRAVAIAQSKAAFIAKLSIVIEEEDESCFCLEMILDENLMHKEKTEFLMKESKEQTSIFIASRITAQKKL